MVNWILRIESAAVFAAGVTAYIALGGPLILLLPALLAPDLSAIGYLAGPRVGAITYNAVHNFALAVLMLGAAWVTETAWLAVAGAIVAAHVGMDRALGYGLKLTSGFGTRTSVASAGSQPPARRPSAGRDVAAARPPPPAPARWRRPAPTRQG